MSLTIYAWQDFYDAFQSALANGSPKFSNFAEGSAARALAEATSDNSISLQYVVQQLFDVTRLATCFGNDVDTFVADWGLTRIPAISSSGTVTFTRNNTTVPLLIPVGAVVQTNYTSIPFTVIADSSQAGYSAIQNGYFMDDGTASVNVTVQAQTPGIASNILANTITQIVSGVTGINTLTNALPFTNGSDQESDTTLKARFTLFVSSLAKANYNATNAAIGGVQSNLTWQIIEYFNFDGTAFPGYIVVVDDGSGAISGPVLGDVQAALDAVRAVGVKALAYAPTNVPVTVAVQLSLVTGAIASTVQTAVTAAVTAAINGKGVGVTLHYADVANAVQTTPGVLGYANLDLNGVTGTDVTITLRELARFSGPITFS